MQLLDLTVRRVRRHRDLHLTFAPGLTLIGGANESGKSTLVEALHKGLFLKASATGRGVEELRSRLHPGLPEVEIGFAAAGQQWRLRKRFAGSSGTCQLSHGGGLNLSGAAAEEQLARLLGVEGAVEGRRIAQLPLRWAHLWVRQGEAGGNLLDGPAEGYDLPRLIEQLQQGEGGDAALESPLDRRVIDSLQRQLDLQFTATGKVRAGSPLAEANQRLQRAQQQLDAALALRDQLEGSLTALQQVEERLAHLEQRQAPALEQLRQLRNQQQLQRAELTPLEQRLLQLQQAQGEWQRLHQQQRQQASEQQQLQQQLSAHQSELGQALASIDQLSTRLQQLEQQREQLERQRQLAQLLLDQEQLQRDQAQRQQHQHDFEQLQQQAETIKAQLAALPAINPDQLGALRQLQLQAAQAEARRQASATRVELLAADLPVQLGDRALSTGQAAELLRSSELQVGQGVRLRISPGGGDAPQRADADLQAAQAALAAQLELLGVDQLPQAEATASQRQALEANLQQLRQAAAAIPWARLQQEQGEQQQRQQRLAAALAPLDQLSQQLQQQGELPSGRQQLEQWRRTLEQQASMLEQQRGQAQGELQQARQVHANLDQQLRAQDQQLQQLAGSLAGLAQRRAALVELHGEAAALAQAISDLEQQCRGRRAALAELEQQLGAAEARVGAGSGTLDAEERLRQLQAEQGELLTQRGQEQQRIFSLSAQDPAAALEQAEAELEDAQAEQRRQQQQAQALRLLLEQFDRERRNLSRRYSAPLGQAVGRYLASLRCSGYEAALDFEPSQGFGNLQLRQGSEGFRFEELSGGMREQLNAALRLAIAEVLQPAYDGCLPLLFDDAFTNSDPDRQEGLRRMLRHGLQQGLQIVLLSCTPELYAPLLEGGGQRLELPAPEAGP